jgi:hypothetical protein
MVSPASYTIFTDGVKYFAKNGTTGALDFASTNASWVIMSCINHLPKVLVSLPFGNTSTIYAPSGVIDFTAQNFTIPTRIHIPLGSRIILDGGGITYQDSNTGLRGGTQIISNDPHGILVCESYGTLSNGTYVTQVSGSYFFVNNMEFVQNVAFYNSSQQAFILDGASQGYLDNVAVVSYKSFPYMLNGDGIHIDTHHYGCTWRWTQVQVAGFSQDVRDWSDELYVNNLDLADSNQSLILWVTPYTAFYGVHWRYVRNMVTVAGGDDDLYLNNVYIESYQSSSSYYGWWANTATNPGGNPPGLPYFNARVIVDVCEANVGDPWSWNNATAFLFEHVDTKFGTRATAFPTPSTPGIFNNTVYINTNPQIVQITIWGGNVENINLNGTSTTLSGGQFYLYPGQWIEMTYSAAPSWIWNSWSSLN